MVFISDDTDIIRPLPLMGFIKEMTRKIPFRDCESGTRINHVSVRSDGIGL